MKNLIKAYPIITSIFCVLLLVDIAVSFYFHENVNWDWDNFAKYGAPIAEIISAAVVAGALILTMKQNRIIRSQNLKPHYEEMYLKIKKGFEQTGKYPVLNLPSGGGPILPTSLTLMSVIFKARQQMVSSQDFRSDLQDYLQHGKRKSKGETKKATYAGELLFFEHLEDNSLADFGECVKFLDLIQHSPLDGADIQLFKMKMKSDLLITYINIFDNFGSDQTFFLMPVPSKANFDTDLVVWEKFTDSNFNRFHKYFKLALE